MTIVLPKHDENGNRQTFRPVSEKTSLLGHFDEGNLEEITGKNQILAIYGQWVKNKVESESKGKSKGKSESKN